jgi:hypothetical protein
MKKIICFALNFLFLNFVISTHPGRLDKNGGHNGPNGYHYHNGTGNSASGSVPNNPPVVESDESKKNEVLRILRSTNPVNEVSEVDEDYLSELSKYAAMGPTSLAYIDRAVFTHLVNTEFDRRYEDRDKFLRQLQRESEWLKSDITQGKNTAEYTQNLKIIQLFISKEQ